MHFDDDLWIFTHLSPDSHCAFWETEPREPFSGPFKNKLENMVKWSLWNSGLFSGVFIKTEVIVLWEIGGETENTSKYLNDGFSPPHFKNRKRKYAIFSRFFPQTLHWN